MNYLLDEEVTDGYDLDEDGQEDKYGPGEVGNLEFSISANLGSMTIGTEISNGTYDIAVPADIKWFDTGLIVSVGQRLEILASGTN